MAGPMMQKMNAAQIKRLWDKTLQEPYSPGRAGYSPGKPAWKKAEVRPYSPGKAAFFRSDGSSKLQPNYLKRREMGVSEKEPASARERYERTVAKANEQVGRCIKASWIDQR